MFFVYPDDPSLYTLKVLDNSKDYLGDELTMLRNMLDRFKEKIITTIEKAEMMKDNHAQQDL